MSVGVAGPQSTTFPQRLALATQDTGRTLLVGTLAASFILFVVLGKSGSQPGVYGHTVLVQALFALPILAYLGWLLISRRLPGPTRLDWAVFAVAVAYALAIANSVNSRVSFEASLLVAAAILAFYAVHDVRSLSTRFWVRLLIGAGAAFSLLGLLSIGVQYAQWLQQVSDVTGRIGSADLLPPDLFRTQLARTHPSPLAMVLNLCLPFAAAAALASRGTERTLCFAALAVGALALFFTLTRGAWLGTIASGFVFGLLVLADPGLGAGLRRIVSRAFAPRQVRLGLAGLAAGLALAVLVVAMSQPDWLFRSTVDDRFEAASTAIAIFRDHLLTGAGPYTFALLDDFYAAHQSGVVVIVHPHNIYLQVLAELGIVGLLALLFTGIVLVRALRDAWRSSAGPERLYVTAGIAALASVAVHGLSDAPPSWNTVFVPLAVVLAISMRLSPIPFASSPRPTLIPRAAMLVLVPLVLLSWAVLDLAHSHYDRSLNALAEGQLDVAAAEAVNAAAADDRLYAYALHAGVIRVLQYQDDTSQSYDDPAALQEGISYIERAIELDPHSTLGYANLALALQLKGDRDGAVAAARSAVADAPGDEDIYAAAGTVFEWAGLADEAISAYVAAVNLNPGLTHAPFWSISPQRLELRSAVIAASDVDACVLARASALYGVYTHDLLELTEACNSLVRETLSPSNRASLALSLFALGATSEAWEQAELARLETPSHRDVLLSTALILASDRSETRYTLLVADARRNRDAAPMLAATYLEGVGESYGLRLLVPASPDKMPASIARMLPNSTESHVEPGSGASSRTATYYSWAALREAPPQTLIQGEWSDFVTPRRLLAWDLGYEVAD